MANALDSKTKRDKLAPRREPYWSPLQKGAAVGFRKLETGDGTWIARWRDDEGKQKYRALGNLEKFDTLCSCSAYDVSLRPRWLEGEVDVCASRAPAAHDSRCRGSLNCKILTLSARRLTTCGKKMTERSGLLLPLLESTDAPDFCKALLTRQIDTKGRVSHETAK